MSELNEQCSNPLCSADAVTKFVRVQERKLKEEFSLCESHATQFLNSQYVGGVYDVELMIVAVENSFGIQFDIELLYRTGLGDGAEKCYMILRQIEGRVFVTIEVGPVEWRIMHRTIAGVWSKRPLTHDVLLSLIRLLGGRIGCVMLSKYDPQDKSYDAVLYIQQTHKTDCVDLRPSDAAILAVMCDVPIFISRDIITAWKVTQQK